MSWQRVTLLAFFKENLSKALFVLLFSGISLLWYFFSGEPFEWKEIEVVDALEWQRLLYSALTFVSLGAFLYWIKFYKLLHFLFVEILGDFRAYKEIKGIIWGGLLLLMYFKIVPWCVGIINEGISFLYNITAFVLYLFPPLGISLILFGGFFLIRKRKNPK
ncbi:hypothetical protein IPN35_04955 [Candidatus Peregrinibacteria bacterium]|nr:MAG: hypothetical protein IPN35_04955 [Candidatus Peregrinibacteria bacterium]